MLHATHREQNSDAAWFHGRNHIRSDRERVARQNTAQMADHIALVIVFGGLNQDNGQAFARDSLCEGLPSHDVEYSHIHTLSGSTNS